MRSFGRLPYLLFLFCSSTLGFSQVNLDSLWKIWNNPKHSDSIRLQAMYDIAFDGYLHSQPDSAYYFSQILFDHAKKKKNILGMAHALNTQGGVFFKKGKFTTAIKLFKQTSDLYLIGGYKREYAKAIFNVGNMYQEQGDITAAMDCFNKGLKTFEELNDKKNIAWTYLSFTTIYLNLHEFKLAQYYSKKALVTFEQLNDQEGIAYSFMNMGIALSQEDSIKLSQKYFEKSLTIAERVDHIGLKLYCLRNLAINYDTEGEHEKAKILFIKGLDLSSNFGDSSSIAGFMTELANNAYMSGKVTEAIKYGETALTIAKRLRSEGITESSRILYNSYKILGQYKKSLELHELLFKMVDSSSSLETRKKIMRKELEYTFDKQKAIDKKENEKLQLASEEELKRSRLILASISGFFILASIISLLLVRQSKLRTKQRSILLEQKLLLSQMNPHFIFNSLNAIQNYIFKKNVLQAGIYLSQFAEMIRMILEFSRKDFITLESELKFLEHYLKLQQLRFDNKFEYNLIVDKEIDTETTLLPPMMAQPFIENAIEHGIFYKTGKGTINITFNKNNKELEYIIEDDGIGLNASKKLKSYSEPKHESLAMTITGERMQILFNNIKKEPIIELIDKKDLDLNTTGVKVKFSVQFKELLSYDKHINN
ncbi:MAG: tetratricopeptide repeat protein [Bacteroidia bacterium]|nr:tetratricopeptide repeat protein [Bacteroidia bacterium]